MKTQALKLVGLLSIALTAVLCAPQRAAADNDDPSGRVARLSYTHGGVSFEPAGADDWVTAVVNRPMTTGDKLWSDNDARAELQIGSAAIRLGSNTGFSFLNLTDNVTQLRLTEGTLNIRVLRLAGDETFEVDTPNLAFTVLRPGRYRINVNESGDATIISVRDGQGEVTGGGSAYTIHPNEAGTFSGIDQISADVGGYGNDDDDFDRWYNDRDRRIDHSTSARYVSSDVVGYEDLDEYGGWRSVPEYGTVWFPHVTVVDWAPYRYGHWVWISPWGWTWVEDEPWGFAPFHYGRWVQVSGYWGWVPCPPRPVVVGVAYIRPVYAPALVAWVGGPHFSVGIGVGGGVGAGVAWFPLGPREVFVPSYRVSRTYVTNVNVTNTTVNNTYVTNVYNTTVVNNRNVNVTNTRYVNQRVPGAVTATSHETFTSAQPVARNMVRVDQREIASAQVSTTATPAVAPQRQAVLGTGARATIRPPAAFENRAVVARTAPPPPPASFDKQEGAIRANGGRPISNSEARQLQPDNSRAADNVRVVARGRDRAPENNPGNNRPGNQQSNPGNQPGQPQYSGRPGAPNNPGQRGTEQPGQGNKPSQAVQPVAGQPGPGNKPTSEMTNPRVYSDRPGAPNNPGQPGNAQPQPGQGNKPSQAVQPVAGQPGPGNKPASEMTNPRVYTDRPSSSRPSNSNANPNPNAGAGNVNPRLEQQHQQELQNLRKQQDVERQKVEQQQYQEQRRLQQNKADQTRQDETRQKQQQQLQQLEQKHGQEQQAVQQRQQQEHQQARPQERPKEPQKQQKDSKPPKDDKEKPPHGNS